MTRHVLALDWTRTVAYAATPSSQGIHIVDRLPGGEEPMPDGSPREAVRGARRRAARDRRPHDGRPRWSRRSGRESRRTPVRSKQLGPRPLAGARRRRHDVDPAFRDRRRAPPWPRGHHSGRASSWPPAPASAPARRWTSCRSSTWHRCCCTSLGPAGARGHRRAACRRRSSRPRSCSGAPCGASRRGAGARAAPRPRTTLDPEEQAAVMDRLRALGYVE